MIPAIWATELPACVIPGTPVDETCLHTSTWRSIINSKSCVADSVVAHYYSVKRSLCQKKLELDFGGHGGLESPKNNFLNL